MEQKALKAQIFTNNIIYSDSAELPVDADFMLPDYCPDILKILKCRAKPMISSKSVSGGSVTADGTVIITVIYCDSKNRIYAYEHQFPFSKVFETGCDCEGAVPECTAKCEYINCRAVTGRKIDIHGAAGIHVKLVKRCCSEVLSDYDDVSVEMLRSTVPSTSPVSFAEKYINIEEEIEKGQGQPPVCSLIRYEAEVCIRESKLLNEKNIVRGELILSVLYSAENGKVQQIRSQLPFSQLIEMPGVGAECSCDTRAEIAYIELKPHSEQSEASNGFSLKAKLLVCTSACCENDTEVILDAYSRRYETSIKKNEMEFQKISRTADETCQIRSTLDFAGTSLGEIADVWCELQSVNTRTEGGEICISGTVIANIIIYDSNGIPLCFEKPVEYSHRIAAEENKNISCEPHIDIRSCNFTITGDSSAELRAELGIRAAVYSSEKIPVVTDFEADEKNPLKKDGNAAMVIYFAGRNENIWDIARRYMASVEEIKKINDVEGILTEEKMIMIPVG